MSEKLLVVNADDLGLSAGVNRGIFEAHERGIVTSASLMVRWPAADEGAAYSKKYPRLGVGLHLDFSEWTIALGEWKPLYEVVDLDDSGALKIEIGGQLLEFVRLMGRGPTHIDSHQHVHQDSRVWAIVKEVANRLKVPLRHDGKIRYCGEFYGQDEHGMAYHEGITVEHLVRIIKGIEPGIIEVACHPGYDDGLATLYKREREMEVAALCDERVKEAIDRAQVKLVNFGEIGGRMSNS